MSSHQFGKTLRLRNQTDFDRVYRSPVYAADRVLVVRGCVNGQTDARLGVSVSRKVGGAVLRNRWKRLIREAFRLNRDQLPAGLDLVVRPRRGAQPSFAAIHGSLPRLARKIAKRMREDRV